MRDFFLPFFLLIVFLGGGQSLAGTLPISVQQEKINLPFWQAKGKAKGGLIIIQGGEARDSQFVNKLSRDLASWGISVTVLNQQHSKVPWIDQLPEALLAIRQRNVRRVCLLHYGPELGVLLNYFSKPQGKRVDGLIIVSGFDLPGTSNQQKQGQNANQTQSVNQGQATNQNQAINPINLTFKLLDVVNDGDYENVHHQFNERVSMFTPEKYRQVRFPGVSHDYLYQEQFLALYLYGWMQKLQGSGGRPKPSLP